MRHRGVARAGVAGLAAALAIAAAPPAAARVLTVGPGQAYAAPSEAAAAAEDGDTIAIAPGSYFDCAVWRGDGLIIEGTAPGAEITDKPCEGKAAFVIRGDGVTVRGLTLTRIRVPDGNGAGIRAEGRNLTVLDTRFVNNQVGILTSATGGFLRVAGSSFIANGSNPGGQQTHAILAGALDLLHVEHSRFETARGGDHILSSARQTELIANYFADEGGRMTGPLVWVNAGSLLLDANRFVLAAHAAERPGAVLATGDMTALEVRGNSLTDPDGQTPLLRNWTGLTATMADNAVPPGTEAVSDSGSAYHRLRAKVADLREEARAAYGIMRHRVAEMARALKLIE